MNYLAFGLILETTLNFDGVLQPSTAVTELLIEEGPVPEKAAQLTRINRRGIKARFGKTENGCILNWPGVGKFKITNGSRIVYQNDGADKHTLRLFLLSEVIGIVLYQRGSFLLHASAVRVMDKGLVFMGVPGAGKSTTATAFGQAGCTVLTDDLVVINLVDGKPCLIPAFSQYKVWKTALIGLNIDYTELEPSFEGADKFLINQPLDLFPTQPIPLQTLTIVLPKKSRTKAGQVKPVRTPVELLKHFPLPVQLLTPAYLQRHFFQTLQITQSVPVCFMQRTPDFQALAHFVAETIADVQEVA